MPGACPKLPLSALISNVSLIQQCAVYEKDSAMNAHAPRPTPTSQKDHVEARPRKSATHDYWPRDFWDVAPDTGTESRPTPSDSTKL